MIFKTTNQNSNSVRLAASRFPLVLVTFICILVIVKTGLGQTLVSKQVFDYTGSDQTLTIPPCITQIKLKIWGAGGGGSQYAGYYGGAGAGGYVEGILNVINGDTYTIMVGEGGATDGTADNVSYGFGGSYAPLAFGGFGGGLSGIFTGNTTILHTDQARALLIAGGGGGGEKATAATECTTGGQGGDVVFAGGMPTMQGESAGGGRIGAGAGGGYNGGLLSLRLSGNGTWYAGEGGTNYVHTSVLNPVSLHSADYGNWNASPHSYYEPPNTTDPDYTPWVSVTNPGIGTATNNAYQKSGHGRVVVEFYSHPITASNDTLICEGAFTTLSVSGGAAYMWNTGSASASITVNPTSIATFTVTETSTGCVDSVTVNVNPKPQVAASSDSICPGETATLNAGGATTYSWSTGATNASINISPTSTQPYTVIGTTNGCTDTAIGTVTVFIPPVADAGANDSVCPGMTANLLVTPNNAGYSFSWLPAASLNNPAVFDPEATPSSTTTYTVTVTDQNSCSSTDSVTISVDLPMNATQTITTVTCFGACNGSATAIVNGGTAPYTYSWTGGCTTASCNNLCAAGYTLTVTDAFGCNSISDTTITEPDTLIAAITTSAAATCNDSCDGSATAIAIGGTSGTGYAFSWNSMPAQNSATAVNLCAGTYTCTITDENNCTSSTTVSVTEPADMVLLVITSETACNASTGTASVDVSGTGAGPYAYIWIPGGQTNSVATALESGSYTVTVTDTNTCQASQTATITVAVNPVTTATASAYTILEGQSTQLSAAGGTAFQWSPDTGLSCDTCSITTASPLINTLYCVTVTDTNACTDTACVAIAVEKPCPGDYKVPTAFSPNNDGFNDKFCLQGWSNCVSDFTILIFDRWGEKVFESNNPGFCWDGTYKTFGTGSQQDMNAAVFVYTVDAVLADGTKISRKGNITLIR